MTLSFADSGVLVVDKPSGVTSHDVVQEVRRLLGAPKVGHGGTLDPMATGVLPILLNEATKLSDLFMEGEKKYEGTLRLGFTSDTQDVTGHISPVDAPLPDRDALLDAAAGFVGRLDQVPPMYSAKKVKGRPLYQYARRGVTLDRPAKKVTVGKFEV